MSAARATMRRAAMSVGAFATGLVVAVCLCLAAALPAMAVSQQGGLASGDADGDATTSSADATASSEGDASSNSSKESLVDTFIAGSDQSCGVAVSVSVDGSTQLRRDYGYEADASSTEVGSQTAFEWGRTSDLLVWAAVMQLVETGDLNLNTSIASYLPEGVALPEGYDSLDLLDLMNHVSGLDVAMVGNTSTLDDHLTDATQALPLFEVESGFDPGAIVGYTPYDALLAAVAVQQVSGTDFVDYVQTHILDPLGMTSTELMVGGDAARAAAGGVYNESGFRLAKGSNGPSGVSAPRTTTSSAFTCFGTVDDLITFGQALMGEGDVSLFADPQTVQTLFTVTRTYPSLGVARIAHGMFSFPFTSGVFGESATTSSGFTSSLYMDPESGLVVAVMANQSARFDITQGIPRILVGRTDIIVGTSSSPDNYVWVGTYQSAGNAALGPAKLLTALDRVVVSVNDQGVLMLDGLTATCLGAGVYSVDTAVDQDVYRFHVSLARGSEFSRADEDYYLVPQYTLAVEFGLLVFAALGGVFCLGYVLHGLLACFSGLRRHRRPRIQIAPLILAFATLVALAAAVWGIYSLSVGIAPAALGALLVGEAVYCVAAVAGIVWMLVTRWRGSTWTRGQNATAILVSLAGIALMLNLVYWDMLVG